MRSSPQPPLAVLTAPLVGVVVVVMLSMAWWHGYTHGRWTMLVACERALVRGVPLPVSQ